VWTVFAGDPRPVVTTAWDESCGFPDSHTLVTQRRREDLGAFDGTDAQVRHLDMLDGVYTTPDRRAEDLARLGAEVRDWVAAHRGQTPVVVLPACAGVSVSPGAADRLLGRVAPLLSALRARGAGKDAAGGREDGAAHSEGPANRAATVSDDGRTSSGAPLLGHASTMLKHLKHRLYQRRRARAQQIGLAVNGDHVAVRDAVLATLAGIRDVGGKSVRVLLAEDLPYLWSQSGDDEVSRLADAHKAVARPFEFHVDRDWKYARIAHYVSQLSVMDPARHRFNQPETIPPVERCWELLGAPDENRAE
jgi:hypothetical protein